MPDRARPPHSPPLPRLLNGSPRPLGATADAGGVNFAVWAPDATAVELCLFDASGRIETARLPLPACDEGVWHGFLPGAAPGLVYGLRAHGPWAPQQGHRFNPAKLLLDPWAREVVGSYGRQAPGDADDAALAAALAAELALHAGHRSDDPGQPDPRDNGVFALKARVTAPDMPPPGSGARPPRPAVPRARTVLYEAHVRGLTMRHPAIPEVLRGSYAALAHPVMLAHYRRIGVTTLNLLPLHFRADEAALQLRGLANYWGYAPIAWLAPETRYCSGHPDTNADAELRAAIDALHAAGLEVVLDVVFNHSAETDEHGPTLSLRGLANARYYQLAPGNAAHYANWTGCGNSVNLNEPRVMELVVGALRHWACHFGVDGFRFDLASTLARGPHSSFSRAAGIFAALQADPLLAGLKWIAEPWDIGAGGYQLGGFPAGWMEWNDQYRDNLRTWWLQRTGDRGLFAHRFAASSQQFRHDARAPTASVNFLAAHDGFTLRDLVSHNHKHNQANGEQNRDGHHHNQSWNCGVEGDTNDAQVLALRHRLQRALLATLLTSQGTPMLLAGDEIGHSQHGNNNAYCQDNPLAWLDWPAADDALTRCVARLAALRHAHPALRQAQWLSGPQESPDEPTVRWLHPDGGELAGRHWNDSADPAIAIRLAAPAQTLGPDDDPAAVLLLVNPDLDPRRFSLPPGTWLARFDSDRDDGCPDPHAAATPAGPAVILPGRTIRIFVDLPHCNPTLVARK